MLSKIAADQQRNVVDPKDTSPTVGGSKLLGAPWPFRSAPSTTPRLVA
jgi:hypothetical protein